MLEVKLVQESKARIRRRVLAQRDEVDAETRADASAAIRTRLAALDTIRAARTLLAFAAFGSEVDLDPLLEELIARRVGVFLPFVQRRSPPELGIARVKDLRADLRRSPMGIREPDPQRRRDARSDRIDVVIAPGVAFDHAGRRIGHGGGFYDRLIPRLSPGTPVIGAAFELQIVTNVPQAPHDVGVDLVVTERRVLTGTPRAADPRRGR